jgi:hypothetical protein
VAYVNTGDWVESCTAVVEHWDGSLELIRWSEIRQQEAALQTEPSPVEVTGNALEQKVA